MAAGLTGLALFASIGVGVAPAMAADIPAGTDHIVVAYGRDYADVAPVIGVLKSYGNHSTLQAVDVIPLK